MSRYAAIFGMAKELNMSNEDLHDLVAAETGKTSLKELSPEEEYQVRRELKRRSGGRPTLPHRTDAGGNPATVRLRRKIFKLAESIGWSRERVDGLGKKMFGVNRQEWLTPEQCSDIIEALKKIHERTTTKELEQISQ